MSNEIENTQTPEDYEAEYDRLWDEANGVQDDTVEENEPTIDNEEERQEQTEEKTEGEIDNEEEEKSEEQKEQERLFKIKARGTELELTEDEIKILASKGIDYTAKTQELARYRQIIELAKDIPTEELNVLRDLKNGNKEAIIKLAKDYDIDLFELDTEKEPNINDYSTNLAQFQLQEVESRIMSDTDTLPKVEKILQVVPDEFKQTMSSKPELLEGLYQDIKSGIGEPIIKEALKTYALYGGDFLQHYVKAGEKIMSQSQHMEITPEEKSTRQKASIPNTKNIGSKKKDYLADAEEIWNMPSEDFRKIKAKVLAKVGMSI